MSDTSTLTRDFDWSATPLGPKAIWSASLVAIHDMMMASPFAMCVGWGPELTLIYNAAYVDFLASRHPSALGQPMRVAWHDVWGDIRPLIDQAMSGQRVQHTDLHLVMTRKGYVEDTYWTFAYSPLRDSGAVTGFLNVAIETTEGVLAGQRRDAAESDLRESEGRLRALNDTLEQQVRERTAELRLYRDVVQSSEAPICVFDTEYRQIAFNRAHGDEFVRIFGRRLQRDAALPDLLPPEQASAMRGLMARALAGEAFTTIQEFGDPNLAKPSWELSYSPLRDSAGQVIGAFHFAKDITERLRAEAALAAAQDALRQAQKLEAVGQLTGGVAHDFNNLLTVIKSSTDLLKRPGLAEDRRSRYVTAISDTVDRAAKLTGQMLAFARRQALKPEIFAACDSIRALADLIGTLTGPRVEIVVDLPEEQCFVNADPSQYDTALVNMVVNARDAMDGSGRLVVAVRLADRIGPVRSAPGRHGDFVAVSITDTGSGIPTDRLEQIFEPFFTTKETGRGTGLGLSQVIGFARQSGGDVTVESEVGHGATFTLYLPRAEPVDEKKGIAEPEPLADGHGMRVLVVEDNADVGAFAVQTLSDLGYNIVLATDGEGALARLAEGSSRFDVVFSDVVMPGMSGIELGHQIRGLYHDLPVVLTSGYSHVLAQNGTYGFELLHKPYSVEQLSRILLKAAAWRRRSPSAG